MRRVDIGSSLVENSRSVRVRYKAITVKDLIDVAYSVIARVEAL